MRTTRLVGPLSPNLSNDKRSAFARKKLQRTADPPPVVNARSRRRIEMTKTETVRTGETVNEIEIVTVVATTATRTGKETGIATGTANGIGTAIMMGEAGNIIEEMIMTKAIGPQGSTGSGITAIGRRNIIRTTTGTRGGSTASIGMTTAGRRVGVRGIDRPRKSGMRGARR